jgi:hypothetical protein
LVIAKTTRAAAPQRCKEELDYGTDRRSIRPQGQGPAVANFQEALLSSSRSPNLITRRGPRWLNGAKSYLPMAARSFGEDTHRLFVSVLPDPQLPSVDTVAETIRRKTEPRAGRTRPLLASSSATRERPSSEPRRAWIEGGAASQQPARTRLQPSRLPNQRRSYSAKLPPTRWRVSSDRIN